MHRREAKGTAPPAKAASSHRKRKKIYVHEIFVVIHNDLDVWTVDTLLLKVWRL